MLRFKQTFRVKASLGAVWKLHEDPKALRELTPPPVSVHIVQVDQLLQAGAHLRFRLSVGPIGTIWDAVYDEFQPYEPGLKCCGFVDRAAHGPFHYWTHHHTFEDAGDGTSTVTDDAQFTIIGGPFGQFITVLAWPFIALMFLYRRYKTQRLLAQGWQA